MAAPAALYVSPTGDDQNTGTDAAHPFKTIEKARDTIRLKKYNQNMQADLFVYLRGGRYELNHTLDFDAQDSGSQGHSVIYKAYQKEEPVICGGRRVTGWKPVPGKPYFVAKVPVEATGPGKGFAPYFWQLYVGGVRAERARSNDMRVSSRAVWWTGTGVAAGVFVKKTDIKDYTNPQDLRVLWLEVFKAIDIPVETISPSPDNPDEVILKFKPPGFDKIANWLKEPQKKPFFIVNALEELDEPGEWYLDQKERLIYDYPATGRTDLNQADVYAPCVEHLVKVNGTQAQPAHHLHLDGITFQNGNWTGGKDRYLGWSQAEIDQDYQSQIPGQVVFAFADDISVTSCTVRHMGSCGIQLLKGCHRALIEGNTTYDTTGAGIAAGVYLRKQETIPASDVCTDIKIRNNVVRDTGRDYGQATGISLFAVHNCLVEHNDVSDTAYTAIHARIGDSGTVNPAIGKLEYKFNKVSNSFADLKWGISDGGALYMHGRYPGSLVEGNVSLHANPGINDEYYSDNYSHTVRWNGNISRDSHAMRPYYAWMAANVGVTFDGNYSDRPSPSVGGGGKQTNFHLVKDNQWPPEAQLIMDNAGLEPAFQHLLKTVYGHDNLAEGKRCVSSSDMDKDHGPSLATDGGWKTFWQADAKAAGASWWEVDLGKTYVLQKVAIMPRQDKYDPQAQKMLEIQASNDPTFKSHVVLAERGEIPWYNKKSPVGRDQYPATNLWEQFLNINQGYRYLRVQSTDPHGVLSMSEFFACGYLATTP